MNKLADIFRQTAAYFKGRAAPKIKPTAPVRCEFCGQPGHKTEDCPNSAKFHVFSVDHDAEDDEGNR